ncbi:squalene/phytoene synthase family protein [Texcoconibacillus texcoconensis]|uniref:Farnesyl-diphosphate farnesyltransferase n=1 Tax=Texcoconibacillus texcoconensis TaxID=1095777 RepID=A0A840QML4_9BACI|nr:phytoene/squalene synthase family protein [Texcoconibacillus texcoconensis]MBB5172581.1 farnesyl-diphosphate farnesyltransferase [Texcoconibacillus texcoconensis]
MSNDKQLQKEAMKMLKKTSRTFYIPITFLKPTLKMTVASAYLCMRAIDEIEDHEQLNNETKSQLLTETSALLKTTFDHKRYQQLVEPYKHLLPEVTLRLGDWIAFCPTDIVEKVQASTSEMAEGMAKWAENDWTIKTKEDLDDYTYYVAGLVGVMLSDLWEWNNGTKTDRELAIAYGRGLQLVNILRNQEEDDERGVSFIPEGWTLDETFSYAEKNLALAEEYMKDLDRRDMILFCQIPLELAKKTLKAMKNGREKMTRSEVEATVEEITSAQQ